MNLLCYMSRDTVQLVSHRDYERDFPPTQDIMFWDKDQWERKYPKDHYLPQKEIRTMQTIIKRLNLTKL